ACSLLPALSIPIKYMNEEASNMLIPGFGWIGLTDTRIKTEILLLPISDSEFCDNDYEIWPILPSMLDLCLSIIWLGMIGLEANMQRILGLMKRGALQASIKPTHRFCNELTATNGTKYMEMPILSIHINKMKEFAQDLGHVTAKYGNLPLHMGIVFGLARTRPHEIKKWGRGFTGAIVC
ncbi:hypothetical protein ACJX0J_040460, partial [Zea mays]